MNFANWMRDIERDVRLTERDRPLRLDREQASDDSALTQTGSKHDDHQQVPVLEHKSEDLSFQRGPGSVPHEHHQ